MRRLDHRHRSVRLVLWGALLVILVLGYLDRHPIRLANQAPESAGMPKRLESGSDVRVVVWSDEITRSAEAGRFDEVDWSWIWVDLLQSEVGPVQVIEAEELTAQTIDGARFIVVTRSAAVHPEVMNATHLLERFVNQGGVLLLERPEGSLRTVFSADGRGGTRTPTAITQVSGVSDDLAEALQQMPLFTRFVGSTGPLQDAETLLSMDGAPVVYRNARAEGWVMTVDFNLPLAVVSLRQGRPTDTELTVQAADPSGAVRVTDLVADPQVLEAQLPYVDLLVHFMIQVVLAGQTALPGFWYYPDGAPGVLLLSHNVYQHGDRAIWLADYEAEQGASSTFYFTFHALPGPEAMSELLSRSGEAAVLWELGNEKEYQNRQPVGLGGLHPFYRQINLVDHRIALSQQQATHEAIWGARIRDGRWSGHYSQNFRRMAAAGLHYDSSLGATPAQPLPVLAYRQGTGRPYPIYDTNGLPLGLYEVPLVACGIAEPERIDDLRVLLQDSQRRSHQAIAVNIDADFLQRQGALQSFDNWQQLIALAGERSHRVMASGALIGFLKAKSATSLQSRIETRPATEERDVQELVMTLQTQGDGEGLWIRIPRRVGERRLRLVRMRDHAQAEPMAYREIETRNGEVFGQEFALFERPPSGQPVEAVYR
ncbi:MAG: hypothetical protein JW797_18205 [Bradymonadales bacterium]|nr:hypothetical protein [Bradymonadales bacterium]